jgi:hypothetical protein
MKSERYLRGLNKRFLKGELPVSDEYITECPHGHGNLSRLYDFTALGFNSPKEFTGAFDVGYCEHRGCGYAIRRKIPEQTAEKIRSKIEDIVSDILKDLEKT